jgi:drug/metabolite transporter (DMT)-like permease
MSHLLGIVLMFAAACSYGISAVIIKLAYGAGLKPGALLTLQNALAVAVLWPLLLVSSGRPRLGARLVRRLLWQGLGGNFALSVCYFWSAQRIDISLLTIILFTYPGLVLAWQLFTENRRAGFWELLTLLLAFAGALLSIDPLHAAASRMDWQGVLLAAGAALSYAFMNVHGQQLSRELPPLAITSVTSTVSTLALVAVLPARSWLRLDFTPQQWIYIAALALFSTVLPMNLMYPAIRRIGAFQASVVSVAELPCILVLACLLLNERMSPWQTGGGILIFLGLLSMGQANRTAK